MIDEWKFGVTETRVDSSRIDDACCLLLSNNMKIWKNNGSNQTVKSFQLFLWKHLMWITRLKTTKNLLLTEIFSLSFNEKQFILNWRLYNAKLGECKCDEWMLFGSPSPSNYNLLLNVIWWKKEKTCFRYCYALLNSEINS